MGIAVTICPEATSGALVDGESLAAVTNTRHTPADSERRRPTNGRVATPSGPRGPGPTGHPRSAEGRVDASRWVVKGVPLLRVVPDGTGTQLVQVSAHHVDVRRAGACTQAVAWMKTNVTGPPA
jgi:hypothetical protein